MQSSQERAQSPWKLVLIGLLALACGFLTMNFHHILRTTHIHLSLAQHHKTTAFCAFAGCKLGADGSAVSDTLPLAKTTEKKLVAEKLAAETLTEEKLAGENLTEGKLAVEKLTEEKLAAEKLTEEKLAAEKLTEEKLAAEKLTEEKLAAEKLAAEKLAAEKLAAEKLANTTKFMTTRVCGSPAVDGYAHVVPKCLEESPTAKWWAEYYAAGGKQADLVVHIEKQADYDGLAVYWGINNKKATVEECAEHCKRHMPNTVDGPFKAVPCNAFAFCPDEVCFEPDAHHHTKGDCWLKFTEGPAWPEINMRGVLPDSYRLRHPQAPAVVQWHSGVLLPPGVELTNGTWGPRWSW